MSEMFKQLIKPINCNTINWTSNELLAYLHALTIIKYGDILCYKSYSNTFSQFGQNSNNINEFISFVSNNFDWYISGDYTELSGNYFDQDGILKSDLQKIIFSVTSL